MKMSQFFFSTLREAPSDAEATSHKIMLRAGLVKQLAAGIYSYMPLGLRVLRNIERVIREEMDAAGAQELLMPVLQPAELWKQSGRYDVYGPELIRLTDRHQREFALGPTHEEVITSIVQHEVKSYRKLPVTLYQIQTKFRDERRPRFGLLRTREFLMKDAYSFDTDWEGLELSYRAMYDAYHRIFNRLGLNFRAVEADGGAIGGEGGTHEFMALTEIGEDIIASCSDCQYSANIEKAEVLRDNSAQEHIIADYESPAKIYTPNIRTIEELEQFFQVEASQIMKTMVYNVDGRLVAVVVRGDYEVNETKVKGYLMALSIELADSTVIENQLQSATGFVGPIGLNIPVMVDYSVLGMTDSIVGANEQDYHYKHVTATRDLDLSQVGDFRNAVEGDCCPRCDEGRLQFSHGIELGHIFKLGTKYSEALGATFLNQQGKSQPIIMGCYGIGISRILSAIIEQSHREQGMVWPLSVSPYQLHIVVVSYADPVQRTLADKLEEQLQQRGVSVLIDDRDERAGVKFKDADLVGIPYRIIVGKDAVNGQVEWLDRRNDHRELLITDAVLERLHDLFG